MEEWTQEVIAGICFDLTVHGKVNSIRVMNQARVRLAAAGAPEVRLAEAHAARAIKTAKEKHVSPSFFFARTELPLCPSIDSDSLPS